MKNECDNWIFRDIELGVPELPGHFNVVFFPAEDIAKLEGTVKGEDVWIKFNSEHIKDCDGSFNVRQEFGDFFRRRFVICENSRKRTHEKEKARYEKWDRFFGNLFLRFKDCISVYEESNVVVIGKE